MKDTAGVNDFGDLICPHCRANVVTPISESGGLMEVVAGVSQCPLCHKEFKVTGRNASLSNHRNFNFVSMNLESLLDKILKR